MTQSLERAAGDRLFELSRTTSGCAEDRLFHWLHALEKARIDTEHDYLTSAIQAAVGEIKAHGEYAQKVIAHIEAEKVRVEAESPCIDIHTKARIGPVTVHPCTQGG